MARDKIENVILITIDSLRADHLSCLGYHRKTTPILDEIAKHGILFTNAISNGSNTPSSFRPILTSTPLSMYNDDRYLSRYRMTIQEILKKEDYSTAAYHSNPYLSSILGYNRGFDTFNEILCVEKNMVLGGIKTKGIESIIHTFLFKSKLIKFKLNKLYKFSKGEPFARANTLNRMARSWLKKHQERFFVWLHYMDVHTPYVPQREYLKLFSSLSNNIITDLKIYLKIKKNVVKNNTEKITKKDLKLLIDYYDAEIRYTDAQLGLFFDELKKMGILHKTLIIITSDHGEEFFEHGVFGHASEHLYDELIRVPLIIYAPWLGENIVIEDQVELLSIAPTIIDVIGLGEIDEFIGKSLIPIIKGEKRGAEAVISESSRNKIAYREPEWKFILDKESKKCEIYNLKQDPKEKKNIAKWKKDKVEEFKQKILYHERMINKKKMKRRIKRLKVINKV